MMNQKLKQIFDTIKYDDKYTKEFEGAYLKNATFDKKTKSLDVSIHNVTNLTATYRFKKTTSSKW